MTEFYLGFFALYCLVVISSLPATAGAFKCTTSYEEGPSLYWGDRNLSIVPSAFPGQDLTADQLRDALEWGAAQWSEQDILLGENQACSDLEIEVGPAQHTDLRAGYDWHEPENNRNLVVFRRGQSHMPGDRFPDAIAMTTVTFVRHTGEILDVTLNLMTKTFFLLIAILVQMQPVRWYTI